MSIKYYLQPNPITPDPNDQSARVLPLSVLDESGIILEMERRGSSLTRSDMLSCLNLFFAVVTDKVAEGNFVNLPIANLRPSIAGVFASATDSFDTSRHVKRASISSGMLLNHKIQLAGVEKVSQPVPEPVLIEFQDVVSQTTNSKLSPSGIGIIVGEELKFEPGGTNEGIYFIQDNGTEHKVSVIARRTEGTLMFSIPDGMPSGTYRLEVRKSYKNSQTLRSGVLPEPLNVS